MSLAHLYMPQDRRDALFHRRPLVEDGAHSILFCDIAGFTPLTEVLVRLLGPARGAELLTSYLNLIFERLISQVDRFAGSVISFAGDAMTCLFPEPSAYRATACALAMQHAIQQIGRLWLPDSTPIVFAMKIVVVSGAVRRFLVGDPTIQVMDVLAGRTLDHLAAIEHAAQPGEVLLDEPTARQLGDLISITGWREANDTTPRCVEVTAIEPPPDTMLLAEDDRLLLADIPDTAAARPWLLPPVYERLIEGQEQFLADIRPTVVLFLSFRGIDYDNDPDAGSKLQTYIQWAQQILARYEGFLLQIITGDKGSYFYAAFGSPLAHDDDSARAVAAALDLHNLPPSCAFIRDVKIGLSEGWAYAGAYGGRTRHTYGVQGDEVNLAARLMQAALPGQILISQRIARIVAQQYTLQSLGEIQVKGKNAPVPVSLVLQQQQALLTPTGLLVHHALVGREREIAWLDQSFAHVLDGHGRVVHIEGAAGVGKSHLVSAWSAQVRQRGAQVVAGICQSVNQQVSYTPWRPIVSTLLGVSHTVLPMLPLEEQIARISEALASYNPDWLLRLPLIGDVLSIPIPDNPTTAAFDARLRQDSLFALLIDLFRICARTQPLLLRLEDVHWIDEASAALLQAVGRVIANQPILLCLTQRPMPKEQTHALPELATFSYYASLTLAELDVASVQALVEDTLQGSASPLLLSLVYTRAQGNPFFVEELIDTLHEADMLMQQEDATWTLSAEIVQQLHEAHCLERTAAGDWAVTTNTSLTTVLNLPDSVYTAVLSRIDRLPEVQKLTLKAASVVGQLFELDMLLRIHPLHLSETALLDQVQDLAQRDFVRRESAPPGRLYAFRHNITQEVTYATMLEEQRRYLHQSVAQAMEAMNPTAVEWLAYHYSRTDIRDKMLLYLDLAARKSRYEYANETALIYYAQALKHEQRWEWHYGRAATYHILGQREAEEHALRLLEAAPDVPAFAVGFLWGQYYEALSDYEQAEVAFVRARVDYHERGNPAGEARCLAQLGVVARRRGDYASAAIRLEQALGLLEGDTGQTVEGAQVYAQALNEMGTIHANQGRYEEAKACYTHALEISRAHGNRENEALALSNFGTIAYEQRDFATANDYHKQSLELRQSIGDRAGEGASLQNLSIQRQGSGDYSDAQKYGLAALEIQQAIGNKWEEINVWNSLGIFYQELGVLDQAQECLQRGLELSREIGDEAGEAYVLANLGLVAVDAEDNDRAEHILKEGLALAQAQHDDWLAANILHYRSTARMHMMDFQGAISYASTALQLRHKLDVRPNEADDLAILALAHLRSGAIDSALNYAQQALAVLDECEGEGPEFPQRNYFLCSQVFAAVGDAATAQRALQAAYRLIITRAEKITDPELRRSFLERVAINRQIVAEMQKDTAPPPEEEQGCTAD
jgi:predicted ATPase/class 3 adenylate cyclase